MTREHVDEAESIDPRFSFLIDSRPGKPRTTGITFIQASGPFYAVLDADHLQGLLEYASAWIDWYKFTVGSHVFQPPELVDKKLKLLDAHDVEAFPGGNFLEDAFQAGETTACLEALQDVGFPRLEVSTTTLDIGLDEKAAVIEQAVDMGFDVHGEVGRKTSSDEDLLSIARVIEDMERCLDAGADKVIFESDEFEAAFTGDNIEMNEEVGDVIDEIVGAIGAENVVFEVPLTQETAVLDAAAWLINTVGSDVNLGNVNPNYINLVEQNRRGIGPRVSK